MLGRGREWLWLWGSSSPLSLLPVEAESGSCRSSSHNISSVSEAGREPSEGRRSLTSCGRAGMSVGIPLLSPCITQWWWIFWTILQKLLPKTFGFSQILTWVCGDELFSGTLWSLFLSARAYFGGADEKSLSLCSSASSASSSSLERSSEAPYGGLLREFCNVHRISINTNMNVQLFKKCSSKESVLPVSSLICRAGCCLQVDVVWFLLSLPLCFPRPQTSLLFYSSSVYE